MDSTFCRHFSHTSEQWIILLHHDKTERKQTNSAQLPASRDVPDTVLWHHRSHSSPRWSFLAFVRDSSYQDHYFLRAGHSGQPEIYKRVIGSAVHKTNGVSHFLSYTQMSHKIVLWRNVDFPRLAVYSRLYVLILTEIVHTLWFDVFQRNLLKSISAEKVLPSRTVDRRTTFVSGARRKMLIWHFLVDTESTSSCAKWKAIFGLQLHKFGVYKRSQWISRRKWKASYQHKRNKGEKSSLLNFMSEDWSWIDYLAFSPPQKCRTNQKRRWKEERNTRVKKKRSKSPVRCRECRDR